MYDRLVSDEVLSMAIGRRIYVGKSKGSQALDQEEINRLLVNLASKGRRVCRLKGGDPFVFGRGGEEAAHLAGAGVGFEVVPGVTSAIAAPAYAGIPVTDRRASASFACVTAHRRPNQPPIDWTSLTRACDTIVVLMGASRLDRVAGELAEAGLEASHPVAVVESGTLPDQRVIRGTLADIAAEAAEAGIGSPAVVVVGECRRSRRFHRLDQPATASRRQRHGDARRRFERRSFVPPQIARRARPGHADDTDSTAGRRVSLTRRGSRYRRAATGSCSPAPARSFTSSESSSGRAGTLARSRRAGWP